MNKTLINKTSTLGFITIAIAAGVIGMTQGPQTANAQVEVKCWKIPSDAGEGWTRNVCSNSDEDSWNTPDGRECWGNEKTGNTQCEGEPPINIG